MIAFALFLAIYFVIAIMVAGLIPAFGYLLVMASCGFVIILVGGLKRVEDVRLWILGNKVRAARVLVFVAAFVGFSFYLRREAIQLVADVPLVISWFWMFDVILGSRVRKQG